MFHPSAGWPCGGGGEYGGGGGAAVSWVFAHGLHSPGASGVTTIGDDPDPALSDPEPAWARTGSGQGSRSGSSLMVRPSALCDDGTTMSAPSTDSWADPADRAGRPAPGAEGLRSADDSYVGGVAGGLAAHLGVDPFLVRVFFAITAIFGFGIVFYAGPVDHAPARHRPEAGRARGSRRPPGRASGPRRRAAAQGRRRRWSRSARWPSASPGGRRRLRRAGALLAGAHRRRSASWCCGARPTRRSASAGSTAPAGSTCGACVVGDGGAAAYARLAGRHRPARRRAADLRRPERHGRRSPATSCWPARSASSACRWSSGRGCSGSPPTSARSAPPGCASRSGPTSPPTCTTRCCRRSR